MRLALTGMSGSGKSYWSRRLSKVGFLRFCCDDLIAVRLASELSTEGGGSLELGEWMGFPFDPHYEERESKYLSYEIQVAEEILDELANRSGDAHENIVVDTTGSVIYTGENVLTKLRRHTTVVHLSTPPEVQKRALQAYMARPRPLLWHGFFKKEAQETNEDALARCYPELLSARERLYERFADVTIGYEKHHGKGLSVDDFLTEVFSKLVASR